MRMQKNLIRVFTLLDEDTILSLEAEHAERPHERILQKAIAKDVTIRVHSEKDYETAIKASNILFGKSTQEDLISLSEEDFLAIFDGVPQGSIPMIDLVEGLDIVDALSSKSGFLKSNGEARRDLKQNCISLNKSKVQSHYTIEEKDLLNGKYLLLQKGKKNYFVLKVEK